MKLSNTLKPPDIKPTTKYSLKLGNIRLVAFLEGTETDRAWSILTEIDYTGGWQARLVYVSLLVRYIAGRLCMYSNGKDFRGLCFARLSLSFYCEYCFILLSRCLAWNNKTSIDLNGTRISLCSKSNQHYIYLKYQIS